MRGAPRGAGAASKAALNELSEVARLELADQGITVSTLYPFIIATEFHSSRAGGDPVRSSDGPTPQTA